jgi:hypothetical protein
VSILSGFPRRATAACGVRSRRVQRSRADVSGRELRSRAR